MELHKAQFSKSDTNNKIMYANHENRTELLLTILQKYKNEKNPYFFNCFKWNNEIFLKKMIFALNYYCIFFFSQSTV